MQLVSIKASYHHLRSLVRWRWVTALLLISLHPRTTSSLHEWTYKSSTLTAKYLSRTA